MIRSSDATAGLARTAAAIVLVVCIGSTAAWGADEQASARALFADGRRLAAAGDYAAACPKFDDSYRLDPGIGTNFNLADCLEHIGRTASAWARFLDVAAATRAAGQTEREKVARARAAALEPRLARLTIVVDAPVDGLVVKRDGTAVGAASWGVPVPVDPGPHAIDAAAPRKQTWSKTVDVPQAGGEVRVEIHLLADSPPDPTPIQTPLRTVTTAPREPRRVSPIMVALGAVGLAGLAVGTTFGIKFLLTNNRLHNICPNNPNSCPMEMVDQSNGLRDDALRYRDYELVAFGVGAAAAATAAYLWWHSAPSRSVPETALARLAAAPSFFPNGPGLTLTLAF